VNTSGPVAVQGTQAVLAHQAFDSMLATGFAGFAEIEKNTRSPVDAMTGDEGRADQAQKSCVFLSSV